MDHYQKVLGTLALLLTLVLASTASAQVELIDGFGGPAGYGSTLARNDDEFHGPIDLTPAFPVGVNFFDRVHTTVWLNNNGNITFAGGVSWYTALAFPASPNPMIAPFWGDVDTRGTTDIDAGRENFAYWHIDAVGGRFIGTWYNVGYYSSHTDQLNSFQVIVTNRDDITPGDFDFEFRYNRCEWLTGDASGGAGGHGGTEAQMGFDAGDSENFWSHPDSQTPEIIHLCTTSNVEEPGVWRFEVRSGQPTLCGDGIVSGEEECDDGNMDNNDGCTGCTVYFDIDGDGYYGDVDCDDDDATINPGAEDVCDGVDNDCDGEIDAGLSSDDDVDGHFATGSCAEPADDCDDTNPLIHGGADEICDGLDNDCDGEIDEGLSTDEDGDGHSTDGSCIGPDDDCDDTDATRYPGAEEICDGLDNDCDGDIPGVELDGDGDGVAFCEGDCDDTRADVYPGASELCDGVDNDCNAETDEEVDADGDGFTVCEGDCDDTNPDINPDAVEICDEVDNDCNPETDETVDSDGDGLSICEGDCSEGDPDTYDGAPELCDGLDNDCDGEIPADEADADEDGQRGCEGDCDDADPTVGDGFPELCDGIDNDCDGDLTGEYEDTDGDGLTPCEGDCDDTNADVYTGADEICDGLDNDCDGEVPADEVDEDGDGVLLCADDCDDTDASVFPGAEEVCDGLDNDCDGEVPADEADSDGDGAAICDDDCDDEDASVFPGAEEVCDGIDNNCDGEADEGLATDEDGDGHYAVDSCGEPADDCDDSNAAVFPGAEEIEDLLDNDCDGEIDEDLDDGGYSGGSCKCRLSGTRSGFKTLLRLLLGFLF